MPLLHHHPATGIEVQVICENGRISAIIPSDRQSVAARLASAMSGRGMTETNMIALIQDQIAIFIKEKELIGISFGNQHVYEGISFFTAVFALALVLIRDDLFEIIIGALQQDQGIISVRISQDRVDVSTVTIHGNFKTSYTPSNNSGVPSIH